MSDNIHLKKQTASDSFTSTANDLPPQRTSKSLKPVSPPLSNTRLNRLIYLLILLTTILSAYYSYRLVQFKTEVGGWWNLALGRRPSYTHTHQDDFSLVRNVRRGKAGAPNNVEESVEDRINALAHALGMPSKDLASAIAVAVREYVPPASLSSIAAKETGTAVQAMLQGGTSTESDSQSTGVGVVGGVMGGMDSFVGMEEPV